MNERLGYALRLGVATGALTAIVGLAHTELGRPLLALLPGGCPANLESADPRQSEAFRVATMQKGAGTGRAGATPAWHFTLGSTTRREVENWAARRGVQCNDARKNSVLRCSDDPCADPAIRVVDAHLQFDAEGRLVAVDLVRRRTTAAIAGAHMAATRDDLQRKVGPTTHRMGDFHGDSLGQHRFHRVEVEYRYQSYLAKLSATNLGLESLLVREQYQWWPTES